MLLYSPDKNQIQVTLTNNWDLKVTETLVVQKGALEFYETFTYKSLTNLLKNDTILLSLSHEKGARDSSAKVGCTSSTEINKVNEYVNSLGLNIICKFVWNDLFDNSDVCLFALRLNNGHTAILRGTDIESFNSKHETAKKTDYIEIKFKKSVIGLWSDITKRNINRSIAIVLDDHLLTAPIVRAEINGGNCEITGDFTQNQVKYIAAVGNNGELPVTFRVVK